MKQVVLITGGTSGIGLATAKLLSSEGAKIIVTGRNPETLAAAQRELPGVIVIKSDSASLSAAQSLGGKVKKHVDHLDGVFLNAGIVTFTPFESETPKHFDDMFNVNVRGPYFQLQSLLPLLGNPSAVVFTSSLSASLAGPSQSVYSATKAAVSSFGKTLAVELAPRGIRVNVISPGLVETPMRANKPDGMLTTAVLPSLIWGPHMPMLAGMVANFKAGRFAWPGGGQQVMSSSHVDNVCHCAILAAERAPGGRAYFVTDGEDRTVREVIGQLVATQDRKSTRLNSSH